MVYTIHEIPIFIAMGVVGKGQRVAPSLPSPPFPVTLGGLQEPPAEQSVRRVGPTPAHRSRAA